MRSHVGSGVKKKRVICNTMASVLSAKLVRHVAYRLPGLHRLMNGVHLEPVASENNLKNFHKMVAPLLSEQNLLSVSCEPFCPTQHAGTTMLLYVNAVHQALRPSFYHSLQLENAFALQHRMVVLHLWMLKYILAVQTVDESASLKRHAQAVGKALFKELWIHHRRAIKLGNVGVTDTTTYRKILHTEALAFALALDESMLESGKTSRLDNETPLMKCLHKHVFMDNPQAKPQARILEKYMQGAFDKWKQVPVHFILSGAMAWNRPPRFQ
eukprot:TRINITY_DN5975_c0_g1_i2.p1 TRINITY_DN5975_c0_g1~~TRINITY_DN5975_c0_g1_i2.p1  ORF type:complete len:270 (-),score=33.87 TRINITY_DN5975_c0_g1_i2:165-974(-)